MTQHIFASLVLRKFDRIKGKMSASQMVVAAEPTLTLGSVVELASRVLADNKLAVEWMLEPNLATDNKPPVELVGTEQGLKRVENLLLRIEYGVLA